VKKRRSGTLICCRRLISVVTSCCHGIGSENGKKRGCGTLKCLKALSKGHKSGNQKLHVEFSRLGGAVGDNARSLMK